ncbi:ninja-family protein AFP3-like [Andrographis paniculata]|uniref:ninja-family protein AFP3-like n=1 Tax=Andrographis paniculata TaxID=175694 RepID=UPI0021E908F7|nr:ninja-family protein AFP3-like [Andrographis paniculata]
MECLPTPAINEPARFGQVASSMGDAESSKSSSSTRTIEMENLSLDVSTSNFSRNLLQRFMGSSRDDAGVGAGGRDDNEDDDVELNLGLSLGGRFGVDKSPKTSLLRSSSVASCLPTIRDDSDAAAPPAPPSSSLARTSSLPVETEEEWRKRKEMQSLRRMEAKRRRSEKQRNLKIDKDGGASAAGGLSLEERKEIEVSLRGRLDREKTLAALRRSASSIRPHLRLSDWAAGSSTAGGGIPAPAPAQMVSQGSLESKGGSSSSVSDLDSRPMAGSSCELDSSSIQSFQDSGSHDAAAAGASRSRGNSMEEMPCVFTKGDGPNGKRIEGILYKYGKGEEVRIMCICHGTFHSPAEFVRHAGGTDVDHPLKHIVVNPNSSPLH